MSIFLAGTSLLLINFWIIQVYYNTHQYNLKPSRLLEDKDAVLTSLLSEKINHNSTGNSGVLFSGDRNLIFVALDVGVNDTIGQFVSNILLFHPEVIFLGSLMELLDGLYIGTSSSEIRAFLERLYACHDDVLPIFVQYANEMLIRSDQPKWCASNRKRSQTGQHTRIRVQISHNHTRMGYCRAPPKSVFNKLCDSHHIVIDVLPDFHDLPTLDIKHTKTLRVIRSISDKNTASCYISVSSPLLFTENETDIWTLAAQRDEFVINDSPDNRTLGYCIIEMFNYMDIYFSSSFIDNIWSLVTL